MNRVSGEEHYDVEMLLCSISRARLIRCSHDMPPEREGVGERESARERDRGRERRGACSRPRMRRLRTGRLPRKNMMTALALGIQKQDKQEASTYFSVAYADSASRTPPSPTKNRYASRQEMEGWRAGNGRRDPNPPTCQNGRSLVTQ